MNQDVAQGDAGDEQLQDQGAPATELQHLAVLNDLRQREPIFHHPEFGRTRVDFENMTDARFWEVGASGRRYSRSYVLDVLEQRYADPQYQGVNSPPEDAWRTTDFHCLQIAPDNFLLTYTLVQGVRITRRATLWRRSGGGWKILYHQGTVVAGSQEVLSGKLELDRRGRQGLAA